MSGGAAHEVSSWGRLPATVRGWTRGQSQRLEGEPAQRHLNMRAEAANVLLAAAYEWTKSWSMLRSTSWTTEDPMTLMAEGLAVEIKEELSVVMQNGFPEDV